MPPPPPQVPSSSGQGEEVGALQTPLPHSLTPGVRRFWQEMEKAFPRAPTFSRVLQPSAARDVSCSAKESPGRVGFIWDTDPLQLPLVQAAVR